MGKQVDARFNGGVAQLGEHLPCKQGVKSSNLSVSIRQTKSSPPTKKIRITIRYTANTYQSFRKKQSFFHANLRFAIVP